MTNTTSYDVSPVPSVVAGAKRRRQEVMESLKNYTCHSCSGGWSTIRIPECGHTFHARCLSIFPVRSCPNCKVSVDKLSVIRFEQSDNVGMRNGKWTQEEEMYVQALITDFLEGRLPCGQGTPVRLVLARMLNCSPMRLSKKFQKKALGKHTYSIPKSKVISLDKEQHQERMRHLSALESKFYEQLAKQTIRQGLGSKNSDGMTELEGCILAANEFATSQFVKFALKIGQALVGYDIPTMKRSKRQRRVGQIANATQAHDVFGGFFGGSGKAEMSSKSSLMAKAGEQVRPPSVPSPLGLQRSLSCAYGTNSVGFAVAPPAPLSRSLSDGRARSSGAGSTPHGITSPGGSFRDYTLTDSPMVSASLSTPAPSSAPLSGSAVATISPRQSAKINRTGLSKLPSQEHCALPPPSCPNSAGLLQGFGNHFSFSKQYLEEFALSEPFVDSLLPLQQQQMGFGPLGSSMSSTSLGVSQHSQQERLFQQPCQDSTSIALATKSVTDSNAAQHSSLPAHMSANTKWDSILAEPLELKDSNVQLDVLSGTQDLELFFLQNSELDTLSDDPLEFEDSYLGSILDNRVSIDF